ncbi:MAG: putative selenium-dependent hydroxylase accessory protein YqeC [Chloroflexi bacterium]|nr:MAG: putative selenium-dependent hydroxylase accessory protein YqeC [Phototrophicales bacterium]RMF78625.1 MAG: putative selenium-dependent hydroxylase accessory protein YqeC [Chloroflexota bacterium]
MKLHEAFNVSRGDVIAFIGAGGKTSTLIRLGHELADEGWRVLATTTTRIADEQLELMPYATTLEGGVQNLSRALTEHHFVYLYDDIRQKKVYGPPLERIPELLDSVDSDVLLIEADGARQLLLKAPYEHEPVIPPETSLVVPIASLGILGKPLTDEYVYNAEAIMSRYGFVKGNRVRSPWVAQVLRDEELGLRGIPDNARVVALINGTPKQGYLRGRARLIAQLALRSSRLNGVVLGNVRGAQAAHEVQRHIGAVILAAGMSTRMGQMKVLLPWTGGKTIIEHIIEQAFRSRFNYTVVVTGHRGEEVRKIARAAGAKTAHNRAYKNGEMLSSLKTGLRAMPKHISAALVILGDQPRIEPRVIYQLLAAYAEQKGEIVAPRFNKQRGHPVLIDRKYWPELLALRGNSAPRDVLNAHEDSIHYIDVTTDSVLRDVDTPQDYERERWRAGLSPHD